MNSTRAHTFICTVPVAVSTVLGFLDLLEVSIISELKSFVLSMRIEALKSTTNIRSSVSLAPSQETKT